MAQPVPAAANPKAQGAGPVMQIGAFPSRAEAEAALAAAAGRDPALANNGRRVESVVVKGATLFRAQFTGFDVAAATAACAKLRGRGGDCLVKK